VFDPEAFVEEQVPAIQKAVDGKAVIAVSGGVDSVVCAVLAAKALGDRLTAVYVDTGLMRKGETEEKKTGATHLLQGTIAPDWIESGGQLRDRIKSHHNVAGLPETMALKLVEPLRDLYKDEVRKVARTLGVSVAERQPFPGPALAVRCLGEVTLEKTGVVREACAIVEEEIERASDAGAMARPWQYFAVLLQSKSVGVHGDIRVYGFTVVVRAVESLDGMTAAYVKIPHEVLEKISMRITNEVAGVNRVVYDISHKPPSTIEWE
jgi:GMP synthase (glutamine-hydrolysing)